jgi:hypothetical protein
MVRSGVQEPDFVPQAILILHSEKFIGTIFLRIQFIPHKGCISIVEGSR